MCKKCRATAEKRIFFLANRPILSTVELAVRNVTRTKTNQNYGSEREGERRMATTACRFPAPAHHAEVIILCNRA